MVGKVPYTIQKVNRGFIYTNKYLNGCTKKKLDMRRSSLFLPSYYSHKSKATSHALALVIITCTISFLTPLKAFLFLPPHKS